LRLDQVLVNLLNNAAKYTEPGGHIHLALEREGGEGVLRVRDNGVGIPPEMLERIFDLFAQVDRSLASTRQWGLGIGLTLVRSLVEMHGGSVRAFSPGPGRGSEFVVRLPLLVGVVAPPTADAREPGAGGMRVSATPSVCVAPRGRRILSWTTTRTWRKAWPCCCAAGGTRSASPTTARRPWRPRGPTPRR
jgi:hypothetical protein